MIIREVLEPLLEIIREVLEQLLEIIRVVLQQVLQILREALLWSINEMKIHHDNNKGSAPGISKEFPSIAKDHDKRLGRLWKAIEQKYI